MDRFEESRELIVTILTNTLRDLTEINPVSGSSPYARMNDERRAKTEFDGILTNLGRTLGQQTETRSILVQLVQAIEIQRGVRATSTALKLENEIGISFSQYDPKKVGFTLRVDLRDVIDRERSEKRSNPFWY